MKINKFILPLTFCLFLLFSSWICDNGGDSIKGRYNTFWLDTYLDRSLCYSNTDGEIGGRIKVDAFINRIGFDNRYIIAERIYFKAFQMPGPDYDSITYYIIDTEFESEFGNKDVLGPFELDEFKEKKREHGIEDLNFTEEYRDW